MARFATDLEDRTATPQDAMREASGGTDENSPPGTNGLLSHPLTRRGFLSQASAAGVVATVRSWKASRAAHMLEPLPATV